MVEYIEVAAWASLLTVLLVLANIYLTHFSPERSDVSLSSSNRTTPNVNTRRSGLRFYIPLILTNAGEKDGVHTDVWFKYLEFPEEEYRVEQEQFLKNSITERMRDTNRLEAHSTNEIQFRGDIEFNDSVKSRVEELVVRSTNCEVGITVHIQDNRGEYDIEHTEVVGISGIVDAEF